MKHLVIVIGSALCLSACSGRWDPDWTFLNPTCMPDGSVVYYEVPNKGGEYAGMKNSHANCPWNQPKPSSGS